MHLKELPTLPNGYEVDPGDEVGIIGDTGPVTGPHLHMTIVVGNESWGGNYGYGSLINPQFFYPDYNFNFSYYLDD